MKKTLLLGAIFTSILAITSCTKNNGCPNSSDKAIVRDFTSIDTCGIVFELEDGSKVEPMNLSEWQAFEFVDDQLVWLKFKNVSGQSTCQLGDVVRIQCVSEREF
jgi:hypothetical protein